jgi:Zn-dependent M28 family amino/carboxypeptidase
LQQNAETSEMVPVRDFAASTRRVEGEIQTEGELVFVGYGVKAPEYDWDDYKDADLHGKILLMLVNDPPGEDIFGGPAMTYYGRWTYKYEIAARVGAVGALVIHQTGPAGYPWEVISNSNKTKFVLPSDDGGEELLDVEGWLHVNAARKILEMAGQDFDQLYEAADTRSFHPVPLGITARFHLRNSISRLESANVVAKLQGADAPDECIVYSAHWDHLGIDPSLPGDPIFNGAVDNASGTAGLLEIAQAFGRLEEKLRRSVVFIALTAEEQGLLGSHYYAQHPLCPVAKTVAAINMDGLNVWGPTRDLTVIGMGQSSLDQLAERIAGEQGRVLRADPEPEKGLYYRSDHFEFAKVGIPAFDPDAGIDYINRPEGWGLEMRQRYTTEDYHKPSDEVKDDWELSGAVEDLELFYRMGDELAAGTDWPTWNETSEFRAIRERSQSPQ